MAEALRNDFPELTRVFSIHSTYNHNISVDEQIFESDIIACGPEFIEAFDYYSDPGRWILGNPLDILKEVNTTILTRSLAKRLFREPQKALGQVVSMSNGTRLTVEGVMEDPPANTNYPFDQLVSQATYVPFLSNSFGSVSSATTFVQLPAAVDPECLQPALDRFNEKYMEAVWGEDFVSMGLQALADIHLDDRF